jgi:alanine dehydrogenase
MVALGMGARVVLLERSVRRIYELDSEFGLRLVTRYSTIEILEEELRDADLVVGATLIPGAAAPKVIKRAHLGLMKRGSVIVDVAIDQGGCTETSRPTTHADPTYVEGGVVHYCVANMPGAVAGRMSIQAGAHSLELAQGGSGVLLPGVPGVAPGKILIIGGGVVGSNAAMVALGMGARVALLERSVRRIYELDSEFGLRLVTRYSTIEILEEELREADLVIGATLIPGAAAPKLIKRAHLGLMKRGSVIVDVAIDQGGCTETSRPTTHAEPTYVVDGVVHYCVANMPGGVANTSTFALNNVTLPYVCAIADKGYRQACLDDPHLLAGLNVHHGRITHDAVARDLGLPYTPPKQALEAA